MQKVQEFIQSQKLMVIAVANGKDVWIANVYFGVDENGALYFVSPEDTKHSKMILNNPNIAFSIAWFDSHNHRNRKAVQGKGICRPTENEEEIATGVKLHNENFPEFKERITVEWIHYNEWNSKIWVLKPMYIKYWDDELYGSEEFEEFTF